MDLEKDLEVIVTGTRISESARAGPPTTGISWDRAASMPSIILQGDPQAIPQKRRLSWRKARKVEETSQGVSPTPPVSDGAEGVS